eukprot:GHVP01020215.1.p1 GENE.GHVP01020215.1~~GHVP01020215.1.p1  ORF type:complete len:305 (+),score=73.59 GHVP01020215.1:116-916(+)
MSEEMESFDWRIIRLKIQRTSLKTANQRCNFNEKSQELTKLVAKNKNKHQENQKQLANKLMIIKSRSDKELRDRKNIEDKHKKQMENLNKNFNDLQKDMQQKLRSNVQVVEEKLEKEIKENVEFIKNELKDSIRQSKDFSTKEIEKTLESYVKTRSDRINIYIKEKEKEATLYKNEIEENITNGQNVAKLEEDRALNMKECIIDLSTASTREKKNHIDILEQEKSSFQHEHQKASELLKENVKARTFSQIESRNKMTSRTNPTKLS